MTERGQLRQEDVGLTVGLTDICTSGTETTAQLAFHLSRSRILRFDAERFGAHACQPAPDNLGGHLRGVIGSDMLWDVPDQHGVSYSLRDAQAVDPPGAAGLAGIPW